MKLSNLHIPHESNFAVGFQIDGLGYAYALVNFSTTGPPSASVVDYADGSNSQLLTYLRKSKQGYDNAGEWVVRLTDEQALMINTYARQRIEWLRESIVSGAYTVSTHRSPLGVPVDYEAIDTITVDGERVPRALVGVLIGEYGSNYANELRHPWGIGVDANLWKASILAQFREREGARNSTL